MITHDLVIKMLDFVKDPSCGTFEYGKWGSLNIEQRQLIRELCKSWLILDGATNKQTLEIERLNKKIEQYENPEDMTLMFMWCDEKAKDEIKRLNNIINDLLDRQKEALRYIGNHLSLDSRYKHGNGDEELILVRKILNKHTK